MNNKSIIKISAAIEFIETHLAEKLDLTNVAAAVHYSKYHLHRMFSDTIGLTVHDYIQRRRLTEAAKLLVFSKNPIIEIAALAGYETQQAFTNIFTAMYKQPPNQYRENEKFYPLQLRFRLEKNYKMLDTKKNNNWNVVFAIEDDIPACMELVRLIVDGFPHLQEDKYILELKRHIKNQEALILKDNLVAIGIMLFSYQSGSIDFMGTHPLYRKKGIPKVFLDKVMGELIKKKQISITTYREGDRADTGYRNEIQALGFAEAELLIEFDYPTQRFILQREVVQNE